MMHSGAHVRFSTVMNLNLNGSNLSSVYNKAHLSLSVLNHEIFGRQRHFPPPVPRSPTWPLPIAYLLQCDQKQ